MRFPDKDSIFLIDYMFLGLDEAGIDCGIG